MINNKAGIIPFMTFYFVRLVFLVLSCLVIDRVIRTVVVVVVVM